MKSTILLASVAGLVALASASPHGSGQGKWHSKSGWKPSAWIEHKDYSKASGDWKNWAQKLGLGQSDDTNTDHDDGSEDESQGSDDDSDSQEQSTTPTVEFEVGVTTAAEPVTETTAAAIVQSVICPSDVPQGVMFESTDEMRTCAVITTSDAAYCIGASSAELKGGADTCEQHADCGINGYCIRVVGSSQVCWSLRTDCAEVAAMASQEL